jgi:hypothetical protein
MRPTSLQCPALQICRGFECDEFTKEPRNEADRVRDEAHILSAICGDPDHKVPARQASQQPVRGTSKRHFLSPRRCDVELDVKDAPAARNEGHRGLFQRVSGREATAESSADRGKHFLPVREEVVAKNVVVAFLAKEVRLVVERVRVDVELDSVPRSWQTVPPLHVPPLSTP